jgi:hypothetical protein
MNTSGFIAEGLHSLGNTAAAHARNRFLLFLLLHTPSVRLLLLFALEFTGVDGSGRGEAVVAIAEEVCRDGR